MEHEQLILEVSQVNSYIKEMLDTDGLLGSASAESSATIKNIPRAITILP